MNTRDLIGRLQEVEKEILRLSATTEDNVESMGIRFTIEETEFLLALLSNTNIPGKSTLLVAELLQKIKLIHKVLLEKGVVVK